MTEDDFQDRLTWYPNDWSTRLVFADWLQDRDDPRAEGYRALGIHQLVPLRARRWQQNAKRWFWTDTVTGRPYGNALKEAWYARTLDPDLYAPKGYRTRRKAEDAAARAFARLSAVRRAELLHQPAQVAA